MDEECSEDISKFLYRFKNNNNNNTCILKNFRVGATIANSNNENNENHLSPYISLVFEINNNNQINLIPMEMTYAQFQVK